MLLWSRTISLLHSTATKSVGHRKAGLARIIMAKELDSNVSNINQQFSNINQQFFFCPLSHCKDLFHGEKNLASNVRLTSEPHLEEQVILEFIFFLFGKKQILIKHF